MDKEILKQTLQWISQYGIKAYAPSTIAADLNLDLNQVYETAYLAIDSALSNAVKSAQVKTGTDYPETEEELFDFILTFFEELAHHHGAFRIICSPDNLSLEHLKFGPAADSMTMIIFHKYLSTSVDRITCTILFLKVFHTWLTDLSPDLSKTCHEINQICKAVYLYN